MRMTPATLLGLVVLLVACSDETALRIGAKSFTEQRILAETLSLLLKDGGIAVQPIVECGDTYACYNALQQGDIDLLVDYTGTGLVFQGETIPRNGDPLARVREVYKPLGISWLIPLGFNNTYRLIVRTDRAQALNLTTISNLGKIQEGVTITCPREYLRRPLDGLQSLFDHYGFRYRHKPMLLESPTERVNAVLDGKVLAAVLYSTDGSILDPRLTSLTDDLSFFPQYDAVVLARDKALLSHDRLATLLAPLDGRIDIQTMRRLNRAVELEGLSPAFVASDLLLNQELLIPREDNEKKIPDLVVALPEDDNLGRFEIRALAVVRQSFSGRAVVAQSTRDPMAMVRRGDARLALVGAESFFSPPPEPALREARLEAVVVIGKQALHQLCRIDGGPSALTDKRIGIQPPASGGGRIATRLLTSLGLEANIQVPRPDLLDNLLRGDLDCILALAEPGEAGISTALEQGTIALIPLPRDLLPVPGAPYLRPWRIPAGTYHGQTEAVESAGAQVVLAAPRQSEIPEATGGPATALPSGGKPLAAEKIQRLAHVATYHEAPDPVLPSAWRTALSYRPDPPGSSDATAAIINLLVFAFLAWLVYLVVKKD